ncbi:hypothetical protein SAMN02949497_1643 [Methylomagnum ishizawai]|uniref:Integrase catalytic domain-containing protein n=1 Tax=Methylomagnum ishizawai TaxID=1760988 RepID=A0A1Y6D0H9_9GAMM|nr:hypothetical protein [Methylomagnum ishizawai]SMF94333.1 hypothetical protein SAMN02949497_1643 [Methylomagnum ishizawai]
MDPRRAVIVTRYLDKLDATPHGEKQAVIDAACAELGVSRGTFNTLARKIRGRKNKKRTPPEGKASATAAGVSALTLEEAKLIMTYIMETYRKNGKRRAVPLDEAVSVLRDNGEIIAGRVDPETGEIFRLSISQIRKAMRAYHLHPDQMRNPAPANGLNTPHPNHMWQIDASVCVLYYLNDGGAVVEEIDEAVHYKNKPHNLEAIASWRVIRYVLTDHTTNLTRWRYYRHSESGEHVVEFLCWAMAPKPDPGIDPFEGRPEHLYVDPGIGNNRLVQTFCRRLGIELRSHKPRRARATGSVENGQLRVELRFESGLKFQRHTIKSFDDLNALAQTYQLRYNSDPTKTVGRHGMTRMDAWMHIREEHLVRTQPMDVLLSLATKDPKTPKISDAMRIEFQGRTYSVVGVPGAYPRGKVTVHWHPFLECAMALVEDAEGRETLIELEDVTGTVDPANEQWGFHTDTARYGQEYKSRPDTEVDTLRKEITLLASNSATQEEDEKKRRRKDFVPFDGRIDPCKAAKEAEPPIRIKKHAVDLMLTAPGLELIPLNHIQAAKLLKGRMGDAWTAEHFADLQRRYPKGVPEADIESLLEEFQGGKAPAQKPVLKVVK